MTQALNIAGKSFGRLRVLGRIANTKDGRSRWRCVCICGIKLSAVGKELVSGHIKSCGCLQRDWAISGQKRPGTAFRQILKNYKCRSANRGIEFCLSAEQFFALTQKLCYYCGSKPSNLYRRKSDEFIYNGLDRLNNSRGYNSDNVVPCCETCNTMKMGLSVNEFINHLSTIFRFVGLQLSEIK